MKVTINGEPHDLIAGLTLAELVADRLGSGKGIAAAVDGEVAPRTTWTAVVLCDGQAIELLAAVQGG